MSGKIKIEKLEELIKGSIDGEIVEQSLERLVPPGENFGSIIYKVDFKVKNGDKEETFHAVAKCTPPNKVAQEIYNIQVTTKAEIGWYTTLIPTIQNFQREHGVKDVADFFQKFYGARINLDPNSDIIDLDAVILTENLKPLGYENVDRHVGFDLITSKAILRNLAIFQAVAIAIKLENKELFDKNIYPYLPGLQTKIDPSMKNIIDPYKDIKNGFETIPELSSYKDRIATNLEAYEGRNTPATARKPWGSISHNDFWINNIMVKAEDGPKTVFLDFQILSYASIANDLIFFLVVSVDQDIIAEHMDELIKFYWTEFLRTLQYFKVDDTLFTYDEFLKEIDKEASSGLFGRALFHIHMILMDKGSNNFDSSNENFGKEDFQKNNNECNDKHKKKYKWIVLEFIKRGWI